MHARTVLTIAALTTAVVVGSSAAGVLARTPRGTRADPPRLLNPAEVNQAVARNYPPLVRDAGIGGATEILVDVDRTGMPRAFRVLRTDHPALAETAERALRIARFAPAREGGVPVAGTYRYIAQFSPSESSPANGGSVTISVTGAAARLQNVGEVKTAAVRLYPPLIRSAGISGRAVVEVSRDAEGRVTSAQVVSATHPAFAHPAEAAARQARFAVGDPGDVRLVFEFRP